MENDFPDTLLITLPVSGKFEVIQQTPGKFLTNESQVKYDRLFPERNTSCYV